MIKRGLAGDGVLMGVSKKWVGDGCNWQWHIRYQGF